MSDDQVVRAWLMICPLSPNRPDGTANEPTASEIQSQRQRPGRVAELRNRLSNPSWLIRQLAQYMGIRCNAEDNMTGHFWQARFGMRRLLDEPAVLACLAYVDLNPIRAGVVESLEGYQHVSIGERLRTLHHQNVDSSDWLAPLGLTERAGREPVTGANHLSHQELDEPSTAQQQQPLGCLPMSLQDYAELLRWLVGQRGKSERVNRGDSAPLILRRFSLDPIGFADLVNEFSKLFFTSAGCPTSLDAEARRRGRRRLNGPGKRLLVSCVQHATANSNSPA
jgi:hypothetical protein